MEARNHSYLDLVRTEKQYLKSIESLIELFVVPLRYSEFLAPHECASMFSNIELIATAHKDLLKNLEDCAVDWPFIPSVGKIFLELTPLLKAYSVYVGNFKNSMNEIERKVRESPKFAAFLVDAEKNSIADLQTLLSMPVNRLSQLEVHMQALSETLKEGSPEHEDCINALSILVHSNAVVQRSLVESAETAKLFDCQRRLRSDGPVALMKPGRRLLLEARFKRHTIVLLNDQIIICKPNEKTFGGSKRIKASASGHSSSKKRSGEELRVKATIDIGKFIVKDTGDKNFEIKVDEKNPQNAGEVFKFVSGSVEDKNNFLRVYNRAEEEKNRRKVFGQPLPDIVAREERSNGIPYVVEKVIVYLRAGKLDTPGMFRVAGSKSEITAIQEIMDRGGEEAQKLDFSKYNIMSICDLLKQFFRMFPEPMLGYSLYQPLLELMRDGNVDITERLEKIRELIFMWTPGFAVKVLRYLMEFLVEVSRFSDVNKMTSSNLSIVFGPTLLWPEQNTLESAMDMPYINGCVQLMIEHYDATLG